MGASEKPLYFECDYQEGAHPVIMARLAQTNMDQTLGYGEDAYCEEARALIRDACSCPDAEVHFLIGGTQTNATVLDGLLASYQGVVAADTGHVSVHEAGAIEFGGHKVLELPSVLGKLSADTIEGCISSWENDESCEHMVMPGVVYLSQPTEYGTLYSLKELEDIAAVCSVHGTKLYVDGARLAYALAAPENDVTLPDLARLCDAFYIGGTKCGTLFGEAVVIPKPNTIPHFFTIIKQHGALLAKGRLLGIQFAELFRTGLYGRIGESANQAADRIRNELRQLGVPLLYDAPTNQVFAVVEDAVLPELRTQVVYSFWEKPDESHTVIRLATSWATQPSAVDALVDVLRRVFG
ncbi:MAG: threonine aldolase family protein [Eggerthellaceae bacterium]|jgi:threonine aldolase